MRVHSTVGEQHELLPGPEGGHPDLLEVILAQAGEGAKVNLLAEEQVRVLGQALQRRWR